MGISIDHFVNSVQNEFLCSICHDVMEMAMMLDLCEHAFCKSCIDKWQAQTTTDVTHCPVCREQISVVKKPPHFFINLLHSLELRCPFRTEASGCNLVLQLGDYSAHISNCASNPEKLADCDGGCGLTMKQSERGGHNCMQYLKEELACVKQKLEKEQGRVSQLELQIPTAGATGPPAQPPTLRQLRATTKDLHVTVNEPGCLGRKIDPERLNLLLAVIALELNTTGVPDTSEGVADFAKKVEATAERGISNYFQWNTYVLRPGELSFQETRELLKNGIPSACHTLCIQGFGLEIWVVPID